MPVMTHGARRPEPIAPVRIVRVELHAEGGLVRVLEVTPAMLARPDAHLRIDVYGRRAFLAELP